ncbi:MAG: DUF6524 family protein [Rhodobacteraceae bacterium]|jgi:hypothetical protein|nr:DUF6524 family protein [Paracoccaceae bacterium]
MGFVLRLILSFVLVAATWNPTAFSYVRWAMDTPGQVPLKVLGGLVLLALYVVVLTAVLRGIGVLGVILVLGVTAAAAWVLVDWGWLRLDNPGALAWVAIVALSLVLAVGMYWGILWRRLTGQVETEDQPGN